MIAAGTPIPTVTPFDGVGAFEGGGYCNTGIYRPAATCRMREANTPFCPVCRRNIDQSFDRFARQRRLVDVTNRSAEPLWVSCSGHPFCVGRGIAPGETARVRVVDGAFFLSGSYWNGRYLIAPADSFEIFDNVQDPFVPRASGTESDAAVDAL